MFGRVRRKPCAGCPRPRRTFPTSPPFASRQAPGWGSDRTKDPPAEATRRVGPVTGAAGSAGQSGRGGRHRFRLEPRASCCSYQQEALTNFSQQFSRQWTRLGACKPGLSDPTHCSSRSTMPWPPCRSRRGPDPTGSMRSTSCPRPPPCSSTAPPRLGHWSRPCGPGRRPPSHLGATWSRSSSSPRSAASSPGSPGCPDCRLDSPRAKLSAGSVAVAGPWGGIYPLATPGGWRILGHTDAVLWDQNRAEPALLPPGTRVRFVPA